MQQQRIGILAPNECFSISPDDYGKFRTCKETMLIVSWLVIFASVVMF